MAKKNRSAISKLWRLALAAVAAVAVVQELRKPKGEREWHGKVADLVPYDFRKPTFERLRGAYWNPDGPLISNRVFGVGWAVNLAAVPRMVRGGATSE